MLVKTKVHLKWNMHTTYETILHLTAKVNLADSTWSYNKPKLAKFFFWGGAECNMGSFGSSLIRCNSTEKAQHSWHWWLYLYMQFAMLWQILFRGKSRIAVFTNKRSSFCVTRQVRLQPHIALRTDHLFVFIYYLVYTPLAATHMASYMHAFQPLAFPVAASRLCNTLPHSRHCAIMRHINWHWHWHRTSRQRRQWHF